MIWSQIGVDSWYRYLILTGRGIPDYDAAKEIMAAQHAIYGCGVPVSENVTLQVPDSQAYDSFSDDLRQQGLQLIESSCRSGEPAPDSATWFGDSVLVSVNRSVGNNKSCRLWINVVGSDPQRFQEAWNTPFKYFRPYVSIGEVYMLVAGENGPEFMSVGTGGMPLCRENYPDDVLAGYDRIKTELTADAPRGRLTIIEGPAGSGKSTAIRGLLNEVAKAVFIVVPVHLAPTLGDPSMLRALGGLQGQHPSSKLVVILEDADECLAPRSTGNMSVIAALLNLSDGILGTVLDLRILATTNAERHELDEAIKRPGRLSTILHVGKLDSEHANRVYQRLLSCQESPFSRPATLAEIYQKAYDQGWKGVQEKQKRVGF